MDVTHLAVQMCKSKCAPSESLVIKNKINYPPLSQLLSIFFQLIGNQAQKKKEKEKTEVKIS